MMTPQTFALYFTSLFVLTMALKQTALYLKSVDVGTSVALHCLCRDEVAVMFYWYKQILGKRPRLVSTFYKHNNNGSFHDEFKDPRFSLDTGDHADVLLKISDLRESDSATYHCVKSNLHMFEICEGTTVTVKPSGNVQALVHRSASESLRPGASVTLSCSVQTGTCDREHDVYWFRNAEESPPGLIYSRGGRNDECERKPNTQTHTCVFHLPQRNLSVSDEKTHCAVASCGLILFGYRSMQVSQGLSTDEEVPPFLVHVLSGLLAFTIILVVCLVFSMYKMTKHSHRTDCDETFSAPCTLHTQDGENHQYSAVRKNTSRTTGRTDDTFSECVYSSVRQ